MKIYDTYITFPYEIESEANFIIDRISVLLGSLPDSVFLSSMNEDESYANGFLLSVQINVEKPSYHMSSGLISDLLGQLFDNALSIIVSEIEGDDTVVRSYHYYDDNDTQFVYTP